MEPQSNKNLIIGVIIIIALAIAAGVYYSWPKPSPEPVSTTGTTEQQAIDTATQSILVKHSYANGIHTYTGSVQVPSPCYEITAKAIVLQSFPEQVHITIYTIPPAQDSVCEKMIRDKQFTVSYKASETTLAENGQITLDGKSILFIVGGKD